LVWSGVGTTNWRFIFIDAFVVMFENGKGIKRRLFIWHTYLWSIWREQNEGGKYTLAYRIQIAYEV
jgi:hypothetical protein